MVRDITAAVLAGGLGTRLRSALPDEPKALAPVGGRPFLTYLLDHLADGGIRRVVLCTGYLGDKVEAAFGTGYRTLSIEYSHETQSLGTAGALAHALPLLTSDPVLVLNGDTYCDVNLAAFLAWHRARRAAGSLVLSEVGESAAFGSVRVDERGAIRSFQEKSADRGVAEGWPALVSAGVYLLSPEMLTAIPQGEATSIEHTVFPEWVGRGLYGYRGGGRFIDVGTPSSYSEAERFFAHAPGTTATSAGATTSRTEPPRAVLLDRDGTLNHERHYLSDPDGVELLPGTLEGLARLQASGLRLVVVTNQSVIGRGRATPGQIQRVHRRLASLLEAAGVTLDAIYVCPHRPEDACGCRKPDTGLVAQAARELGFDPAEAFAVGDKPCDIELGRRVGAVTILVTTGYGRETLADPAVQPDYAVDNLAEAAEVITYLAGRDAFP